MKKCPTCEKTFEDSYRFCQLDGTPLVDAAPRHVDVRIADACWSFPSGGLLAWSPLAQGQIAADPGVAPETRPRAIPIRQRSIELCPARRRQLGNPPHRRYRFPAMWMYSA